MRSPGGGDAPPPTRPRLPSTRRVFHPVHIQVSGLSYPGIISVTAGGITRSEGRRLRLRNIALIKKLTPPTSLKCDTPGNFHDEIV
jgi:hypothetical protein